MQLVLDTDLRQQFLQSLVRSQAQRHYQFTLRDSDLDQVVLDLIYLPTFKPEEKEVKFMKFNREISDYLKVDIMHYIQTEPNQ